MKLIKMLIPLMLLPLTGCVNNNDNHQYMEKHIVQLNTNNFETYLTVQKETGTYNYRYIFSGCLSFAYYDNVVINIEHTPSSSGSSQKATLLVQLDAGGNGITNYLYSPQIVSVAGTVSYWF